MAAALAYTWWMRCCLQRPVGASPARWTLVLVWMLHTLALGSALAQQPLRFGFAPALSVTAWLVLTVYALEVRLYPRLQPGWQLGGLGAMAVLLAWLFPGASYPLLHSAWLPLHGALGVASYGLLAAALLHAWLMQRAERAMRQGV
ncbi:MAG: cytochrome C assembly protein, partial [Macromonas sp.]